MEQHLYHYYFIFNDKITDLKPYIPDRYSEGYGISEAIKYANSEGINLIIALDCGIKAIEKVRYASSLGIDFIICDHHVPGENALCSRSFKSQTNRL